MKTKIIYFAILTTIFTFFVTVCVLSYITIQRFRSDGGVGEGEFHSHQYLEYDTRKNKFSMGKVSITNPHDSDFLFMKKGDGVYGLISEDGSEVIECTGSCFCEEDVQRRSTGSFVLKRGLVGLFTAVSTVLVVQMAQRKFQNDCVDEFHDELTCPLNNVRSEVHVCTKLKDFDHLGYIEPYSVERMRDLYTNPHNYKGELFDWNKRIKELEESSKLYRCKGNCVPDHITEMPSENAIKARDEANCEQYKYEMELWVRDTMGVVDPKQGFITGHLTDFCMFQGETSFVYEKTDMTEALFPCKATITEGFPRENPSVECTHVEGAFKVYDEGTGEDEDQGPLKELVKGERPESV